MIARIFVCLVLLVGLILTFNDWSPAKLREKISGSNSSPTLSPALKPSDWATILPGQWKNESGTVTIILADGRYEQSGREVFEGPVPSKSVQATLFADYSCRIQGRWTLKGEKFCSSIESVDQLKVHKFDIRSSQVGTAALRDATIKARQQFMFDATHKRKNKTNEVKFVSVKQNEIVYLNAAGKKETARRIK